ncbi:unnamed protein product [Citrullus colocynthis]|uniref:Uncharacterized protein n=1 Tax=Citrullus colocynthis TaxID=252529 RepID=A0ABP0Y6L5_9ROSI
MRVVSPSIQREGAKVTNKNNGSEDDDQTNIKNEKKKGSENQDLVLQRRLCLFRPLTNKGSCRVGVSVESFATHPKGIQGIHPNDACHKLNVYKDAKPVK